MVSDSQQWFSRIIAVFGVNDERGRCDRECYRFTRAPISIPCAFRKAGSSLQSQNFRPQLVYRETKSSTL